MATSKMPKPYDSSISKTVTNEVWCCKVGKIVSVYLSGGDNTYNSGDVIATLPSEYRPNRTLDFVPTPMGGNQLITGRIRNTGEVLLYVASGTIRYFSGTITYTLV